jgi:hypothetical protein
VRDFTNEWEGTGTIEGTGNQEKIILASGETMESPTWNTGVMMVEILVSEYLPGSGSVLVEYKTGSSAALCEAQSYGTYTSPFRSEGYIKVKVTGT